MADLRYWAPPQPDSQGESQNGKLNCLCRFRKMMVPLTNSVKHAAACCGEPKFSWGPLVLGQRCSCHGSPERTASFVHSHADAPPPHTFPCGTSSSTPPPPISASSSWLCSSLPKVHPHHRFQPRPRQYCTVAFASSGALRGVATRNALLTPCRVACRRGAQRPIRSRVTVLFDGAFITHPFASSLLSRGSIGAPRARRASLF